MLKTHNKTGLKYLCKKKTEKEQTCYTYKGSGKYWLAHLKVHGTDITTVILERCKTPDELKNKGLEWSTKLDIVSSDLFANLKPESGDGGYSLANMSKEKIAIVMKKRLSTLRETQKNPKYWENIRRALDIARKARPVTFGEDTRKRQLGHTMRQRMGKGWVDPRTGKKWDQIYKEGYKPSFQKKYKLTLKNTDKFWILNNEREFKEQFNLSPSPVLNLLKKNGEYIFKRIMKRSRHSFKTGDTLLYTPIA